MTGLLDLLDHLQTTPCSLAVWAHLLQTPHRPSRPLNSLDSGWTEIPPPPSGSQFLTGLAQWPRASHGLLHSTHSRQHKSGGNGTWTGNKLSDTRMEFPAVWGRTAHDMAPKEGLTDNWPPLFYILNPTPRLNYRPVATHPVPILCPEQPLRRAWHRPYGAIPARPVS